MRCLVLAFSTLADLPEGWEDIEHIDAWGQVELSTAEREALPHNLRVHDGFFEISAGFTPPEPYDLCYINHPDPWGEPRNWLKAMAAVLESVKGKIHARFWFPHEIRALDYLLFSLDNYVAVGGLRQVEAKEGEPQYEARWTIDEPQSGLYTEYLANTHRLLARFYHQIGPHYDIHATLEQVKGQMRFDLEDS